LNHTERALELGPLLVRLPPARLEAQAEGKIFTGRESRTSGCSKTLGFFGIWIQAVNLAYSPPVNSTGSSVGHALCLNIQANFWPGEFWLLLVEFRNKGNLRSEKEACETRHCVKKKQAIFDQGARYCTEPRLPKSPSGKYYFFAHFEENFSVASSRFPFCRIRTLFTHSSIVLPAFGGWFNVIQEETRRIRKKKEKKRGSGEKGKSNCVRCVRVQCPSGCCLSCC
jgi:hypothetical protein